MTNCTHCQEWEICPFHPKASTAREDAPEYLYPIEPIDIAISRLHEISAERAAVAARHCATATALPAGARLLGPDDPEVLGPATPPDLIYALPGTGRVMGVPQVAMAAAMVPVILDDPFNAAAWSPESIRRAQKLLENWYSADARAMRFRDLVSRGGGVL